MFVVVVMSFGALRNLKLEISSESNQTKRKRNNCRQDTADGATEWSRLTNTIVKIALHYSSKHNIRHDVDTLSVTYFVDDITKHRFLCEQPWQYQI